MRGEKGVKRGRYTYWWIVWKYKGGELKPYGFDPIPKCVDAGDVVYKVRLEEKREAIIVGEARPI